MVSIENISGINRGILKGMKSTGNVVNTFKHTQKSSLDPPWYSDEHSVQPALSLREGQTVDQDQSYFPLACS